MLRHILRHILEMTDGLAAIRAVHYAHWNYTGNQSNELKETNGIQRDTLRHILHIPEFQGIDQMNEKIYSRKTESIVWSARRKAVPKVQDELASDPQLVRTRRASTSWDISLTKPWIRHFTRTPLSSKNQEVSHDINSDLPPFDRGWTAPYHLQRELRSLTGRCSLSPLTEKA